MGGSPRTIGLAVVAAFLAAGCSCSPWSASRPADNRFAGPVVQAAVNPASGPPAATGSGAAGSDAEAMRQVIGELQELGAMDPAAQERLMADLRQTDPAWWPMVVQQFRAAVAYRRQAERRPPGDAGPGDRGPGDDGQVRTVSGTIFPGTGIDTQPRRPPPSDPAQPPPRVPAPAGRPPEPIGRLPVVDAAALAPSGVPPGDYPATPHPETGPHLANRPPELRQVPHLPGQISGASGARPSAGYGDVPLDGRRSADWRAYVAGAIRALESQLQGAPATPEDAARRAQLQLLYLLAGRRDDAVQPIPSVPVPHQEFWSKQLYGLATWLDTDRVTDPTRRAAETKQTLEEAVSSLGELAPLLVRNLAFCTEIQDYGCTKPFKENEFVPDQEVLLYAEVENYTSEATSKGFHTPLRSSYQIFDSRGQRVADHQFPTTEEYCQNPRRDFFIGYRFHLPKRIYAGKHTLQLTIEDLKSHKVGQSSIELTIKDIDK